MKYSAIIIFTLLIFNSCKENNTNTNTELTASDDVINQSLTDTNGNTLSMSFDNTKGTAMLNFKGETITLQSEKPGSGIWYKNVNYKLRGKGNNIQLKKDGAIVFEHKDDIVIIEEKGSNGSILNMTFNNTEGKVKVYLNGGKQIDLTQKKTASGIWYSNDDYELRGKGDNYTLTKNGKIVFEN